MGKHIGEVLPEKRDRISLELQDARNDFDKFADVLWEIFERYGDNDIGSRHHIYDEFKEVLDNERIKQRKVNQ